MSDTQDAEVRQLARDLLLALVQRGEREIDAQTIWQIARDFVAAGQDTDG